MNQRRYKPTLDRTQALLLPERVEDYVGENHQVRALDAYVDTLDLGALGFKHTETGTVAGQPPYNPWSMLKLYLYGYQQGIRSSRKLEAETRRNLEVIWLVKGMRPSYKSIADFRKDHVAQLREVSRDFVLLCRELSLFGGDEVAVDGSFFSANASRGSIQTEGYIDRELENIQRNIEEYQAALEEQDAADDNAGRQDTGNDEVLGEKIHQDASTHRWVCGETWDLVVTMDDATGWIYSAFFVVQEGTWSSMRGVGDVLESKGIFTSFYSDRGSHYWSTPRAGGRVDKENLTQFGRAMKELGIVMIPGYSPEARGRSERMFKTLQGRLPAELEEQGIVEMGEANRYLSESFVDDFNRRFSVAAAEEGSAFVPLLGVGLEDILCLKHQRVVGNDNCVKYKGMSLQIPPVGDRAHFVRAKVVVHEYEDGSMAVVHEGKRRLGFYNREGNLVEEVEQRRKVASG